MTDPIVITHSDLSAFLRCRRSWAWSYIEDVKKPERPIGAAALGKRVHKALEQMYLTGRDPVEVHDEIAKADVVALETEDAPVWEIDQLYTEMIIGRNCCISYRQWLEDEGIMSEFEVKDVERMLEAPILDGRVLLRGKVDIRLVSLNDGMLYTDDWKTTGAQGSVREMFERSYQSPTYHVLSSLTDPEFIPGGSYFTVIRKTKNLARVTRPMVERFRVPATRRVIDTKRRQIEMICTEMLDVIERYKRLGPEVAYPSPMESCRWCDYKQPCELADESMDAANALLGSEYQRGGRHERYDI